MRPRRARGALISGLAWALWMSILMLFWAPGVRAEKIGDLPLPASKSVLLKPSLREFASQLKRGPEISALYKESLKDGFVPDAKKIAEFEKANRDLMRDFRDLVRENASFARSDIEDESVLNGLVGMLQLSLLRIHNWGVTSEKGKSTLSRAKEEAGLWFQFAADLPYNEASLIGLKVTGVVRSLLIDELERLEKTRGDLMAQDELWLTWMLQLRTPWPVDRMVLTEGRRIAQPPPPNLVEKVAIKIQKNPYLSVEGALAQIPGSKPGDLETFKNLWREKDMEGMKTEINRLQLLRLRLACRLYQHRKGAWPTSVAEIVKAKLLPAAPVDYLTGRLMALPAPDSAPPAKNP